jgi:aspartate-semialdehyde dehydrogenase
MKLIRLAVVGASGLVGQTTLEVLQEWQIPLAALRLFASSNSVGRDMEFAGHRIPLEPLDQVPKEADAAIFCTSREVSKLWVPRFRDAGITVIDHSSQYRQDPDVPLVIPEINSHTLVNHKHLISNPNCSASIVLLPLAAIDRAVGLHRIIVDTYQSVSGSGLDAVAELESQLANPGLQPQVYPKQIAHNVFPQVGPFDSSGLCDEERKVVDEIRKILERPQLLVYTTTVRVPVRVGHSAAVTVETARATNRQELEIALLKMPGMVYEREGYRTPREIAGKQEIFVSRLRGEEEGTWFQFWAVGDNLRKGAASNAIQILMELFK